MKSRFISQLQRNQWPRGGITPLAKKWKRRKHSCTCWSCMCGDKRRRRSIRGFKDDFEV